MIKWLGLLLCAGTGLAIIFDKDPMEIQDICLTLELAVFSLCLVLVGISEELITTINNAVKQLTNK
ncbi:hypothetical protein ACFLZ9_01650 [Patescibacteria group bacterium]